MTALRQLLWILWMAVTGSACAFANEPVHVDVLIYVYPQTMLGRDCIGIPSPAVTTATTVMAQSTPGL